jgi:hypothetical protein
MTTACTRQDLSQTEIRAQLVACRHIVRGCERALAELAFDWLESGSPEDEAVHARAAEILDDILTDWKAALETLRSPNPAATT